MVMKLCARCQKLIQAPNRYCDNCRVSVEQQVEQYKQKSNNRYNRQRDKKYIQFYNSKAWRILSKKYRDKHYLCEECQKEAKQNNEYSIQLSEEVHHIDPIKTPEGWERRLDWDNLKALCHIHHDIAEGRFKGKRK